MHIGKGCNICCNIMTSEPYLIEIGNNVTISGNVTFVTHDNYVCKLFGNGNDLYGKIHIGDNCFIGMNSSIMYGINLPASVIVGCGSVVTRFPKRESVVIAGNLARVIGDVDTFGYKFKDKVIYTGDCSVEKREKGIA